MQVFYSFIFLAGLYLMPFQGVQQLSNYSEYAIDPPAGLQPYYGAVVDTGKVTFSWTKTGAKHVYELMIARNLDFSDGQRYSSKDTTLTVNLKFTDGIVFWKVRAFASKLYYSDWSLVYNFYPGINIINNQNNSRAPCGKIGGCAGCRNPCGGRRQYNDIPLNYPD